MSSKLTPVGLISYFFPPIGMAGPARAYALFRYLPEFGYRPLVITVKDILYAAHDDTLLSADDEQYIQRTGSLDPSRLLKKFGKENPPMPNRSGQLSTWATPDFKKYWNPFAFTAAEKLFKQEQCRLFITTSPPPSSHQIGVELKQRFKDEILWLADFRDSWVTNPIESAYNNSRQRKIAEKALGKYQEYADEIVAVNGSVAAFVGAEEVIENGADPNTFQHWDTVDASSTSNTRLRIGYFGATDTRESMRYFCDALKKATESASLNASAVEVLFVGRVDEAMLSAEFSRSGLSESLTIAGYMPRSEGVKKLASVDALLVTTPLDRSAHLTTSKVFDYLVSGKQILAISSQDSEMARLLHAERVAVYSSGSEEDLCLRLQTMLEQCNRGETVAGVSAETLTERREKYSWRALAWRYAQTLDRMIEKQQ